MTRPSKRSQHCRLICQTRFQQESGDGDTQSDQTEDSHDPRDDVVELAIDDCSAESNGHTIDEILKWVEGAYCSSRAAYNSSSRRTLFRKKAEKKRRIDSAKNNQKITEFFSNNSMQIEKQTEPGIVSDTPCDTNLTELSVASSTLSIPVAIEKLKAMTKNTPNVSEQRRINSSTDSWDFLRLMGIRQYLTRMQSEIGKLRVSQEIASFLFPDRNVENQARLIRGWADHFLNTGALPERRQGRYVKVRSLIDDEDVQRVLRVYIRSSSSNALTCSSLAFWVKENLHTEIGLASHVMISEKTGQRWMKKLGLRYGRYRPGLYNDGHERPDVVRYREKFLKRFEDYEKLMIAYSGEFMEHAVMPSLAPGQRPLVLVTHDESCFSSHDGHDFVWLDDNNHPIRPKGDGRSIMVSAFLCECHGLLRLTEDQKHKYPDIPVDATIIIKPGSNADGYWKNEDLVKQLEERVFPIFKILHPDRNGLFLFDNSQNHHAKPPDALSVNIINLKDGGKNARSMRDGWYTNWSGLRINQTLFTEKGLKGLKTILVERGLWPENGLNRDNARQLLASQPDFLQQKEWLEEIVTNAGFVIDFYPKYHCEFNYIEMFWGAAKAYARTNCTYDFKNLVRIVPEALSSVSLAKIRKFARKSYRYIDAYRVRGANGNSLNPKQIEYAVKKYRQHRRIPLRILDDIPVE